MNEFRELIAAADGERFAEPVSAENPASWADLIANINAHNAYHSGQILIIRRLPGSWNREQGVS
jgi:hypothetical protein